VRSNGHDYPASIYSGTGQSATKSDEVDPDSGGAFRALYHAPEVKYQSALPSATALLKQLHWLPVEWRIWFTSPL